MNSTNPIQDNTPNEVLLLQDSGNYALLLAGRLKELGIPARIVQTPCRISRGGCSYCIRMNMKDREAAASLARAMGFPVREMYSMIADEKRFKYLRIYPESKIDSPKQRASELENNSQQQRDMI
ncbi:MAG TPA: hypothetical protein DD727_05540 [Clostridiales bacterium]|nr:hypothetical protein [Clostridiales bacterium]